MFKKSLYLGSVTLVLLALFALAGCSNPAGSSPAGQRGPVIPAAAGAVDDQTLVELYAVNNTVRITTGISGSASSVYGVVPPGKTLEIAGSVYIPTAQTLDVQGVLHILENGELFRQTAATSILLVAQGGSVQVDGFVYEELSFFPITGGLARYVSFGPNGGVVVDDVPANRAEDVNRYFTLVNRVKWNAGVPDLTLDKWVPGKTLLLNGNSTVSGSTDISAKGALVITGNLIPDGTLTQGTTTIEDTGALTTNGIPVLVTESGVLALENTANDSSGQAVLAGKFTVKGTLLASGGFKTSVIPPTVDLSAATLKSDDDDAVFQFPPSTSPDATVVTVKTIDVTANGLGIANTKGLIVDLISNNVLGTPAVKILTLPNNVSTTVNRIAAVPNALTIQGEQTGPASYAILIPAEIYGGQSVTLAGNNILLEAPVKVASDTTIGASDLGPFGITPAAQLAQLVKITGGVVDVSAAPVNFTVPTVLNATLATTGAVTFSADTTLNGKANGLAAAGAATYTIAAGAKLTIGPYGRIDVESTPLLTIGPGVYAASGGSFVIDDSDGSISALALGAALTVGDAANPAKLTLKVNDTVGGTFTPTAAATQLIGAIGGLVVPASGDFELGAQAEIVLGDGATIGLAHDGTNPGTITLSAATSKISGFAAETASIVTPTVADVFKAAAADARTPWEGFNTGLTLGASITFSDHALRGAAATNTISGSATTGGILRSASY